MPPSPCLHDNTGSAEGPAAGQLHKGAQLSPNSALTAKPTLFPFPVPWACTQHCSLLAGWPEGNQRLL